MADIWLNILGDASKLSGALDKAGSKVKQFSEKVSKAGRIATIAGTAVTAAFTAIVFKTAQAGDQFDKMALRTGVAVEDLSSLAYTASICGTDVTTLENSLRFLAKGMKETSDGTGIAKDAFEELGISVIDIEGNLRPTVDVMKEAATKLAAMDDETRKVALAGEIFGSRYGSQLLPMLKIGGEGIEELMQKAIDLNITMSTEAAAAAADFTDAMTDLKGSAAGAGRMIGDTLIPTLTPLIEKATEIVVKITDWVEENAELTEKIFKWAAGLGVALAVLGPIAVILPSLITGVTLLSHAFLPFAVSAGIVLGIKKLSEYLGDVKIKTFEAASGFKEWDLDKTTKGISEVEKIINDLSAELAEAEKEFKLFGITLKNQDVNVDRLKQVIKDYNVELGLLKEREVELKYLQETGIELTYEEIMAKEETTKLTEELEAAEKKLTKEIEDKIEADKLANAQMEIENKLFALQHNAYEVAERDLDLLKVAYEEKGIAQETVDKWYELEIKRLKELDEKQKEHISTMEEVARVTKAVEDIWFELTKFPYEVKIKNINEKYDEYIKVIKASTLSTDEKREATERLNKVREKELEGVDRVTEAEKTLTEATKAVTDRILEMTDPLAYNIQQIDELAETWRLAGVDADLIAEAVRRMKEELEEAPDVGPWEEFFSRIKDKFKDTFENTMQGGLLNVIDASQNAFSDFIYNVLSRTETLGDSIKGLFQSIVDAVLKELARLAAFYVFKWIFGIPTIPIPAPTWGVHNLGGEVKEFQFGGMTDTVMAAVTPGEYIVSKPMTDFIKKFRMFPSNLINAIAGGLPTPAPAFAGGGTVGTPNIIASGFGETKINIDIHDNRIASDVDVKRMAVTISDEVLRKIELKRRH